MSSSTFIMRCNTSAKSRHCARLECESPCPLAYPTAPLVAAGPGGAGHVSLYVTSAGGATARRSASIEKYFIKNQSRMAYAQLMALKLPIGSGAIESTRAARRQSTLERAEPLLVSSQCGGYPTTALLLQGGSVEYVETYGYFTPGSAGSLTGKMGMRPSKKEILIRCT